jgi:release factor glutamine methyltransferase
MTSPDPDPARAMRTALSDAAAQFTFSPTARLDAELLMAHALGIERNQLLLDMARAVPSGFAALVARRAAHEPVAYITGTRGFWTIDLAVGPGALVPRPDSEALLIAAAAHFAPEAPTTILDLGTGPGTLLLAALDGWPHAQGLGVDRSADALRYARDNAARLGMAGRARFVQGDWAAAIAARFDLVLANPPYIGIGESLPDEVRAHEPATALFAGADGLDDYRVLAGQLPRLITPSGCAAVEIGHTQAAAVAALFAEQGLTSVVHHDLGGRDRCLLVRPARRG